MKFRKKPVVVEAEQYIAEKHEPEGLCWELGCGCDCPHIHTLEGVHLVSDGDWIITGIKGELTPEEIKQCEEDARRVLTMDLSTSIDPYWLRQNLINTQRAKALKGKKAEIEEAKREEKERIIKIIQMPYGDDSHTVTNSLLLFRKHILRKIGKP